MATEQQVIDRVKERVKNLFAEKIETAGDAKTQKVLAEAARDVVFVIDKM